MAMEARHHAHIILRRHNPRRDYLEHALAEMRRKTNNATAGIVTGICEDAMRYAGVIDHLINQVSSTPTTKMEQRVLAALRIGVTQVARGVPPHAAVSETVNLLRSDSNAKGLVNAIMRRITESVKVRLMSPEEALVLKQRPHESPLISTKSMPWGQRFVLETEFDYFPQDENERLKVLANFPKLLMKRFTRYLLPEELYQVCVAAAVPPRTWFRMRDGREGQIESILQGIDSIQRLEDESNERFDGTSNAEVEMRGLSIGVQVQSARRFIHSTPFTTGGMTVQDYAAQLPARAMAPDEGEKIIDFCAAPGGKTLQLADAVGDKGHVVAFDQNDKKLRKIQQNLQRWAFSNTSGAFGDAREVTLPDCGKYDAVLVDAPCSNSGVLGRRLEARLRFNGDAVRELHDTQLAILTNAGRHVRSGGRICYSTCSLMDVENGKVVRDFLESQGGEDSGWVMLDEVLTLPTPGGHDGGYFAILRKP